MRRRPDPSRSPPPPAKKPKIADAKPWYHDTMSVLFETPSGFAIFHCRASLIEEPDVLEGLWVDFTKKSSAHALVWLKQFKTFEEKSKAITEDGGVNVILSQMIKKWHSSRMKLAVGKPEYKQIIEEYLNIPCVHGPAVMELMWGIQNNMRTLVPREKKELTVADRLPISHGLHIVLSQYDCVVEPEMVTEDIVQTASALFWCDSVEKENRVPLRNVGRLIESVSGISCHGWSLLKIATAAKAIWGEEIDDSCEVISENDVSRLVRDRHEYELFMDKYGCFEVYHKMMSAHDAWSRNKEILEFFVKKAKKQAKQVAETVCLNDTACLGY